MIPLMILRGVIMKRFVEGADRGQSTLLPECLDDWIDAENPVRVIDAFVDTLDLATSGSTVLSLQRQVVRRIILRFC
jgi:hypothetical protein